MLATPSPGHTRWWVGELFKCQPEKRGPLVSLLRSTYVSGSPTRGGKAERAGITSGWDGGGTGSGDGLVVRRNVFSETSPASGVLE